MIEPLTIKDLNCSTCSNAPVKEINKRYDKFETYKYFCRLTNLWIFGTAFNTMEITGCCLHPLALQVLAQPVIAELEQEKSKHTVNCFDYGMSKDQHEEHGQYLAYGSAINLLKGGEP